MVRVLDGYQHKEIKTFEKIKKQSLNAHLVYHLIVLWKVARNLSDLPRAFDVMSSHRSGYPG